MSQQELLTRVVRVLNDLGIEPLYKKLQEEAGPI